MPPLSGRRIVVTRTAEQAGELLERLRALGAEAISLPTIALAPPGDFAPLDRALRQLASFQGFIFTSVNGVAGFFARAQALGVPPLRPATAWLSAVGPATAAALAQQGWRAEIVPARAVAEAVVDELVAEPVAGQAILLARAEAGRDVIPAALARRGARVEVVATHRTVAATASAAQARALFPGSDAAIFTSPSTARFLAELLGSGYRERLQGTALAAIGPVTRDAIAALGLPVAAEAATADAAALVAALRELWHA